MDFNVEENYEESSESSKKKTNIINWIIIITVSLVCGLAVYFITDAIINPKKNNTKQQEPVKEQSISIGEQTIQILYRYVTYGTRKKRNDKFVKEISTTISSFNDQEKLYYALQFARRGDFTDTGKTDEKGEKIYNISSEKVKAFLGRYFGPTVTVPEKITMPYTFVFSINNKNTGTLKPAEVDGYNIVFDKYESDINPDIVEPFYGKLVAAYQEPSGVYRLEEKVVYTRTEKNGEFYTVYIYKDYNHTKLIQTLSNQTEASLKSNPINVDDYNDSAATITYHFHLDNNQLYYFSSQIDN